MRRLVQLTACLATLVVFCAPALASTSRSGHHRRTHTRARSRSRAHALTGTTPFAASSPWNTPLPNSAALDPHSASLVSGLYSQMKYAYGEAALNTTEYSAPIYTVPRDEPTVDVKWNNCQGKSWLDPLFAQALHDVPIPADAVASLGTDHALVIWQPSTNTDWEFWDAQRSAGAWSACWGGRISDVTDSDGAFPGDTGVSGSGLSLLAGLVKISDLRSGAIAHAIDVAVPEARAGVFSWPAQRSDGAGSSADDPVEGERFRFPASLDLSKFDLSPGELMIAQAIQRYGMIVTDQAGAMSFQAQDPEPFEAEGQPNPYLHYFSGPQYDWLDHIPWQDLQALAWNFGKPSS